MLLQVAVVIVAVITFGFGKLFPRISAYVIGPGILIFASWVFIALHKYFFPFQSDGSPAGMIVPVFMWMFLIACCIVGLSFMGAGFAGMQGRKETKIDS